MSPPPEPSAFHDPTPLSESAPQTSAHDLHDLRVDVTSLKDTVTALSAVIEKLANEAHVRNVIDQSWRDACVGLASAVGKSWVARLILTILTARLFGIDVDLVIEWLAALTGRATE